MFGTKGVGDGGMLMVGAFVPREDGTMQRRMGA